MSTQRHLVIAGSGVSGLSAAYQARKLIPDPRKLQITVLEKNKNRVGGWIQTVQTGLRDEKGPALPIEVGPRTLRLGSPSASALLRMLPDLQLDNAQSLVCLAGSHPAVSNRFVFAHDRLMRVDPFGLIARPPFTKSIWPQIIKNAVFGVREVVEDYEAADAADMSVFDFVASRFHVDLAHNLIDPMMRGIYAADARRLSARAALPQFWRWESTATSRDVHDAKERGGGGGGVLAVRRRRLVLGYLKEEVFGNATHQQTVTSSTREEEENIPESVTQLLEKLGGGKSAGKSGAIFTFDKGLGGGFIVALRDWLLRNNVEIRLGSAVSELCETDLTTTTGGGERGGAETEEEAQRQQRLQRELGLANEQEQREWRERRRQTTLLTKSQPFGNTKFLLKINSADEIAADCVILTTPSFTLPGGGGAGLAETATIRITNSEEYHKGGGTGRKVLSSELIRALTALHTHLEWSSVAVVTLQYAHTHAQHSNSGQSGVPQAFGHLIPSWSNSPHSPYLLGFVYDSRIFADHFAAASSSSSSFASSGAPIRVTAMIGGQWSHLIDLENREFLTRVATQSAHLQLGLHPRDLLPSSSGVHVFVNQSAIPCPQPGHVTRVSAVRRHLAAQFGGRLEIAGASYDGVSVSDCALSGARAVRRMREFLLRDNAE